MDGETFSDFVYKLLLGETDKDMYAMACGQRGGRSDKSTLFALASLGHGQSACCPPGMVIERD